MNELLKYLNEKWANPQDVDNGLVAHFSDTYSVDVKKKGNLYLFKYDIGCSFQHPVTMECRGSIMRFFPSLKMWRTVSRPFAKFFNLSQPGCPYREDHVYTEAVKAGMKAIQKADGSAIQLYCVDEQWKVSTLGAIDTTNIGDFPITFENKFLEVTGFVPSKMHFLDKDWTYLFELCSVENRVVTEYQTDRVYYLTRRNNKTGEYATDDQLNADYLEFCSKKVRNIFMPIAVNLAEKNLYSLSQLTEWVEKQAQDEAQYGETSEGFVLYLNNAPVAKVKNARYCIMHSFGCNDIAASRNNVIQAYFENTLDDVYGKLPLVLKEFAKSLEVKVQNIIASCSEVANKASSMEFPTQKDYALFVQQNADKRFWAFFFSEKTAVMSGLASGVFRNWISSNYKKFIDIWKSNE